MAYFDWNVHPEASREAIAAALQFEADMKIPVRFVDKNRQSTRRDTHARWFGACRRCEHYYYADVTENDFAQKGLSIFTNSYPDDLNIHRFSVDVELTEMYSSVPNPNNEPLNEPLRTMSLVGPIADMVRDAGGVPICENNDGWCIGAAFDNFRCVYLYPGIDYSFINGAVFDFKKLIFDPARAALDPQFLAEAEQRRMAKGREIFSSVLKDRGVLALSEARQRVDQLAVRHARAQEELVSVRGELNGHSRYLDELLKNSDEISDDVITTEWNSILNNANVRDIVVGSNKEALYEDEGAPVTNPYIKLYTKHLWFNNPNTLRKFPLGEFEVTMNFGVNTLRFKNLTMGKIRDAGTMEHPHIRDGHLCAAEYTTAITTLLRDRKIAQLTNMLFTIFRTVTLDDPWGRSGIYFWEEADDQLREERGWPEWTPHEEEHPLAIEMEEANNE